MKSQGEIVGTTSHLVTAPEQLEAASETEISFIGNRKYEKYGPTQGLCCCSQ
jgi:UDP-3-O-[3-hydroxymyristoyl] glucosamine N-acyltransferase